MKLLLTGATGRVGRHLLPRLLVQGHDVRAVARSEDAAAHVKAAGAEPVLADLLDPDGYRAALRGRDAVVHLAAGWGSEPTTCCWMSARAAGGRACTWRSAPAAVWLAPTCRLTRCERPWCEQATNGRSHRRRWWRRPR
jgi:NAD(P)-dependent dehydrogenase (short-subunit alcohol dehydrogenase family)